MKTVEKRLTMVLLCLSGSIIYWLPFISEDLYVPMQEAFGFVSLISYIPGGMLADRVSPRKLITLALVITGAAGLVFATTPSFEVCLVLYGLWGVTTACIFWSSMIKATRNLAASTEQGRGFGSCYCWCDCG